MFEFIGPFLIGILCIVIGISNRKGNISLLHSYHRKRVLDKDKIPMGKMVGLGTIIIGSSIIINSIFSYISFYTKNEFFYSIGSILLGIGLTVGIFISISAIIKYNKGLF